MNIRIGYVGKNNTLDITTSSPVTLSYYRRLGEEKGVEKMKEVGLKNLESLKQILHFNLQNGIFFYRMTSNLIPLVDIDEIPLHLSFFQKELKDIGKIIKKNKIRVDTHPDQFCVLNSTEPRVVENSKRILTYHAQLFDLMNYDGLIILHVGSSKGGKKEALKRFKLNFASLPETIKKKIIIENDDKVFSMLNVLKLCEEMNIPMVLDYHHHLCHKSGAKIENYLIRIFDTWKNTNYPPKMHYSSPKDKKNKRAHHDYICPEDFIAFLNKLKTLKRNVDIMLEAKQKDEALFKLIHTLKYYDYDFENSSTLVLK